MCVHKLPGPLSAGWMGVCFCVCVLALCVFIHEWMLICTWSPLLYTHARTRMQTRTGCVESVLPAASLLSLCRSVRLVVVVDVVAMFFNAKKSFGRGYVCASIKHDRVDICMFFFVPVCVWLACALHCVFVVVDGGDVDVVCLCRSTCTVIVRPFCFPKARVWGCRLGCRAGRWPMRCGTQAVGLSELRMSDSLRD